MDNLRQIVYYICFAAVIIFCVHSCTVDNAYTNCLRTVQSGANIDCSKVK